MSIKNEKIKYNGNDIKIQFSLDSNTEFTGVQEEIDSFTKVQTEKSINDANDGEVKKFKVKPSTQTKILSFRFHQTGTAWNPFFTTAGFTNTEIYELKSNYVNSFFIMDFFDTYNPNNQTKIFSTYLTKLYLNNYNANSNYSMYELIPTTQLYNLYAPLYNITFNGDEFTGYTRFSFYNAKTGKIIVFFNDDNASLDTPEKMYFKTKLNRYDKTWDFITPSMQGTLPQIVAKELYSSTEYVDKYNDTFDNFDNLEQKYPTGSIFNYETVEYTTDE